MTAELNRSRSTDQNDGMEDIKRVLDLLQLIETKMETDSVERDDRERNQELASLRATAHNLVAQLDADGKLSRRSLRRQARRSHPGKALLHMASQSPYLEHSGLPDIA